MSSQHDRAQVRYQRWIGALSVMAILVVMPVFGSRLSTRFHGEAHSATATLAAPSDNLVEPPVFASSNGLLDLLMIAEAQAVPSITYLPPDGNPPVNPIGWVYEVCPRALALPGNQCPSGSSTVAPYGGVRLALQKGDTLKIRLVNRLPALNPIKVQHSADPGGANLPLNLTNLHTHGMLVEARAPTLRDPTFGDYIFVEIYNSANGTPVPQATHQHGSLVKDYADYRIDIPKNHPSGAFWFHPHVHGLALNQVSSGLAGIISVGSAGDYAFGDLSETPFPETGVRHLILKDMQVMAANPDQQFANGTVPVVDGEVLNQQASPFCNQFREEDPPRLGYCLGVGTPPTSGKTSTWFESGGDYWGGKWYFTINGQQYPTINITEADGELWRFTNASGSVSYDLQLINNATQTPMMMQLVSVDGVSIDFQPGTPLATMQQVAGARFRVVPCSAVTTTLTSAPVCIDQLVMMPSSRAEVYVTYRDQNGNVVTPPTGASATLSTIGITMGPVGDAWPQVDLASVQFNQTGPHRFVGSAIDVHGDALKAIQPGGIFDARVPYAHAATLPSGCKPLAPGHHRRIFFSLPDTSNPDVFGLGYEEVDENGAVVPDTELPVTAFDPSTNTLCIPLGPGQTPVTETWELVNLATENHNFHIHQSRFRYVDSSAPADSPLATTIDPSTGAAGVMEDNLPLPIAVANTTVVADNQYGYCTIAQWRDGECTSTPVIVQITFTQLGRFVYHCHILAHEDGGMMAAIQVVPSPSPSRTDSHDFNGDGKSDILWRDTSGDTAIWLMNGTTISNLSSSYVATVSPSTWSIVGQCDFNGDGKADLLWRDTAGDLAIWLMDGTTILNPSSSYVATVPPSTWSIVGTGDFFGTGKCGILWQDTSGDVAIWKMNGTTITNLSSSYVATVSPSTWSIAGVGDFNGDGYSDILWRDTSGDLAIWEMNGTTILNPSTSYVATVSPSVWSISGTGDFYGIGKSGILWRDTSGDVAIWEMSGTSIANLSSSYVASVSPSVWSVAQTGDFYGTGQSSILWRDSSGDVAIWEINGTSILNLSSSYVATVSPSAWTIQSLNAEH